MSANDYYPRLTRLLWQRHLAFSVKSYANDNSRSVPA